MIRKSTFALLSAVVAVAAIAFSIDAHAASITVGALGNHASMFGSFSDMALLGIGSVAAAGNHATKSKLFRVALEGATTDGRTIERAWLEQMAANYDPKTYGARINLEHLRGILPDGPFKAYGDVTALETREETGGKLGLYAQIEPTPALIAMAKAKQKIYTSCEIDPSFADTKQAYLVGLAVTDSPASLGTEILSFAAKNPAASPFAHKKQKPENLFSAAIDEVVIELEAEASAAPSIFTKVKELLGIVKTKADTDDSRFSDLTQAVEALATHGREQSDSFATQSKLMEQIITQVGELKAEAANDRTAFTELEKKLSTTGNGQPPRPAATGATGAIATDC